MSTKEKIADAIKTAVENMELENNLPQRGQDPTPGDLYIFETEEDIAIEWLIIRHHPDDPSLVLLAPTDDFPLSNWPDVTLTTETRKTLNVRAGETTWVPTTACKTRTGYVNDQQLATVKRTLAALARANFPPTPITTDYEYEQWMTQVEKARHTLENKAPS